MDKTSDRIRAVREKIGISQEDFANKIGIPFRTYYRYEKGEREPSTTALINIAHLGNISLNWLLIGKGTMFFHEDDLYGGPASFNENQEQEEHNDDQVAIAFFPDTYASAGSGRINYDAAPSVMHFNQEFLRMQLGINAFKNLHIIIAEGDSMEPTIGSGELLFVLPVENDPSLITGAVYVVNCEGEVFVKRLEKIPFQKSITLHSDNTTYAPITLHDERVDQCRIIGRVVGHFSRI